MKMDKEFLINKSKWLRKELFDLVVKAQKGHIPSSYSCVEIVLSLYYGGHLNFDPKNPKWSHRDRLFISKGHAAMVLYPILADLGFFPKEELSHFCKPDALLRMYADHTIPGIESITGSLGHGLGIAAGQALISKKDRIPYKCFVILGDGECYEGSIWETAMFGAHYNLDNLVAIIDRNRLCIMDNTENCIQLDSLEKKWEAFGWKTFSINAHSYTEVLQALQEVQENKSNRPVAIIANSIKGKGISYMENQPFWHNKMPNKEQVEIAWKELENNCIFD